LRQRSTRYTIRAGRNLPDKEFRYLRTVIVTADIHGDLGSMPRPAEAGLTSHRNLSALVTCHTLYVVLTTLQSAVFLVNSRLTHFTATPSFLLPAERNPNFKIRISKHSSLFRASTFVLRVSSFFAGGKKEGAPLLPKLRG
jgi:hypothetical protein